MASLRSPAFATVLGLSFFVASSATAGAQAPDPVPSETVRRWRAEIAEASDRFGIPIAWIERVMRAESGGRTTRGGRPITSPAGAMGLMQIMPATWLMLRARLGLGPDPHRPRDNILAGTAYLRMMYERFGYPGLFAAYNAGPGRYAGHLASGRPLPMETRAYLAEVTSGLAKVDAVASATAPPQLLVVLGSGAVAAAPPASTSREERPDRLFVIRIAR